MTTKQFMQLELGNSPDQIAATLQSIKDAMAMAIIQKIDLTGIPNAQDASFSVWQSIYQEAHYMAANLFTTLLPHCEAV